MKKDNYKVVSKNKKAYFDYFIIETYEAGISLAGTEVKSIRAGKCNLRDSYVKVDRGEAVIMNMHISPYEHGNIFNKDPVRTRNLLLHKYEINKLIGRVTKDGYTIVPTKLYLKNSLVKLEIAVVKGKKQYDKRHEIAKKDARRSAEKDFKIRNLTV